MISKPIEDPLFRQRYGFSREGNVLRIEIWTEPGGGVRAEHVHPKLEERYEVLEGEVTFRVNRKAQKAGPGERLVVPAGVRHSFENTGSGTRTSLSRRSRRWSYGNRSRTASGSRGQRG